MTTQYRAVRPIPSSLPVKARNELCLDHLTSFCQHGDQCFRNHEICLVQEDNERSAAISNSAPNLLCFGDRIDNDLENPSIDGPGELSTLGPRHDNDRISIHGIRILPTTDEILCLRSPYIPHKDSLIPADTTEQRRRLLDLQFRQLRFDNTESIIDICYHAIQRCIIRPDGNSSGSLDNRNETAQGNQYFLYHDIRFMELDTSERKGVTVPVSFTCPPALRGAQLDRNGRLEKGMLAALIGIDRNRFTLSVTFMEIVSKRSTSVMKLRTGHELRASVTLSFTDENNDDSVRRILYNACGLLSDDLILVEFPKVLLAGFQWCLKRLQKLHAMTEDFAFASQLAGDHKDINTLNGPPAYALTPDFSYDFKILRSDAYSKGGTAFSFRPQETSDGKESKAVLQRLKDETTMDEGQAQSLCESLSRRLAFTQGPPGTGKTYLGVALTKVLLASRPAHDPRPILVVCVTNHALDSFLGDLRSQGIAKFARLGRGSKEEWTQAHDIFTLARNTRLSQSERQNRKLASARCDDLYADCMSLAQCVVRTSAEDRNSNITADIRRAHIHDDCDINKSIKGAQESDDDGSFNDSGNFDLCDEPDVPDEPSEHELSQGTVATGLWVKDCDDEVTQQPRGLQEPQHPSTSGESQITGQGDSLHEPSNADVDTTWVAVRDYLEHYHPLIYNSFVQLERSRDSTVSVARLSRRARGFAFDFWLHGGDLDDIQQLLDHFDSMLGRNKLPMGQDQQERYSALCFKLAQSIADNAKLAANNRLDAQRGSDIWSLGIQERRLLVQSWLHKIGPRATPDKLAELQRRYLSAVSARRELSRPSDARCLLDQDVIGITTTGCARDWDLLRNVGIQTVICEEAGEVLEAESLCTLFPSIEHAIFIGDPEQLRPQVREQVMSLEVSPEYRLDESLFERLTAPHGILVPLQMSHLNVQRRMHPEISELVRRTLYPNLIDHSSTNTHPEVAGLADRVFWFDHNHPEDVVGDKSCSNAFEVDMTCALVEYLIDTNEYDLRDIAVLTPYNGQLAALQKRLRKTCKVWLSQADKDNLVEMGLLPPEQSQVPGQVELAMSDMLRVATIDNFQGEEAKVVILSTVRSNQDNKVGFLKTTNRVNVGCSRAREGFYIVGNASLMRQVDIWNTIVTHLQKRSLIGRAFKTRCHRHPYISQYVHTPGHFAKVAPCPAKCGAILPCGHNCDYPCHGPLLHERLICLRPVVRHYEDCAHELSCLCGEPKRDCRVCEELPSNHLDDAATHNSAENDRPLVKIEKDEMPSSGPSSQIHTPLLVDSILTSIGQTMHTLERDVHRGEVELTTSRKAFHSMLFDSPLSGKINEMRIRERAGTFDQIWEHVDHFMGESSEPQETYQC